MRAPIIGKKTLMLGIISAFLGFNATPGIFEYLCCRISEIGSRGTWE